MLERASRLVLTPAVTLISFLALPGLAPSVSAHHSFAAVYDQSQPLRVEGAVVRLEWSNPHARLHVRSVDADGTETTWTFEMGAPRVLTGQFGWSLDTIKVSDRVIVEGFRARNGGTLAAAQVVTTASGERFRSVLPFR